MLGDDFHGAKLVGWMGTMGKSEPKLGVYDVESGKLTVVSEHPPADGKLYGRPYWSRDGKQIIYGFGGRCYTINADGSNRKEYAPGAAKGGNFCQEAWFQRNPFTGKDGIAFQTCENPSGIKDGVNLYQPERDEVRWICDGHYTAGFNLSQDGTHRGMGFFPPKGLDPVPALYYGGWDHGCNYSQSPDNSYQFMWLLWYHRAFCIWDPFGRRVWRLTGAQFEHLRWSWHPGYCSAVAAWRDAGATGDYKMSPAIIKISTHEMAVLKGVELIWSQLWLPSVPTLSLKKAGPIDDLPLNELGAFKEKLADALCYAPVIDELKRSASPEAKQILAALEEKGKKDFELARRCKDPLDYVPAVREVATRYAGQPVGNEAKAFLESEKVKKEIAAATKWAQIANRSLWSPDWPFVYQTLKYTDPATFEKYKGRFEELSKQIAEFKAAFAGTYHEKVLDEVARRCELPGAVSVKKEQIEVVAKVSKVAPVPQFKEIAPYKEALSSIQYEVQTVLQGDCRENRLLVVHRVMKDKKHTRAAAYKPGDRHRLKLERFDTHPELEQIFRLEGTDDPDLIPWWALETVEETAGPAPAVAPGGKLAIVRAWYGALPDGAKRDVTAEVQALVQGDALTVRATNDTFGDPAPGIRKKLRVEFTFAGAAKVKEADENGTLTISNTGE